MTRERQPLNILVVGAGAVGTFYGAKLSQAGHRVALLCRSDYDVVKAQGVDIKSVWGDFHFDPDLVVRSAAEYAETGRKADVVFVALKVLPEIHVAKIIAPSVTPAQTTILLMQNGVEIEQPIADAFHENPLISGLAFTCINRVQPGKIHHIDYGRITIGNYPEGFSRLARRLAETLGSVEVPVILTEDIVQARWLKLVWNAPFNPMSALAAGATTRDLLHDPESAELARRVMEEVSALAAATGHPLPENAVRRNLEDTAKMTPYKTSMCLDVEQGRPLEVEAILGNAVRAARREGVPVPHIETMYALLRQVDRGLRRASADLNPSTADLKDAT